jgi:hypothetical protein
MVIGFVVDFADCIDQTFGFYELPPVGFVALRVVRLFHFQTQSRIVVELAVELVVGVAVLPLLSPPRFIM